MIIKFLVYAAGMIFIGWLFAQLLIKFAESFKSLAGVVAIINTVDLFSFTF